MNNDDLNNEILINAMFKSIAVTNEQVEQAKPAEQVEQAKPAEQVEQPKLAEQVEQPKPAEQVEQPKPTEQVEQPKLAEQAEQPKPKKSVSIPIVLVDNSGSTATSYSDTGKNILKNEVDIIKRILLDKKYEKCYVMYWNTSQVHLKETIEINVLETSLKTLNVSATGGTDISVAIHGIPDLWFQGTTDIYIYCYLIAK